MRCPGEVLEGSRRCFVQQGLNDGDSKTDVLQVGPDRAGILPERTDLSDPVAAHQ